MFWVGLIRFYSEQVKVPSDVMKEANESLLDPLRNKFWRAESWNQNVRRCSFPFFTNYDGTSTFFISNCNLMIYSNLVLNLSSRQWLPCFVFVECLTAGQYFPGWDQFEFNSITSTYSRDVTILAQLGELPPYQNSDITF